MGEPSLHHRATIGWWEIRPCPATGPIFDCWCSAALRESTAAACQPSIYVLWPLNTRSQPLLAFSQMTPPGGICCQHPYMVWQRGPLCLEEDQAGERVPSVHQHEYLGVVTLLLTSIWHPITSLSPINLLASPSLGWLRWKRICLHCSRPGFSTGSGTFPGEGNGYLVQYSRLENSIDWGARWAPVHGIRNQPREQVHHIPSLQCSDPFSGGREQK